MNQRADGLSHRHPHYIASLGEFEDPNRQLIIAAHGDSR
jgi:hypothetical protein